MLCENHYKHCDTKWILEGCDSFHDDECPKCHSAITPVSSVEFINSEKVTRYHASADNLGTHIFEVSLIGHSDYSNETDGLVLWVEGVSIDEVELLLSPIKALLFGVISITGHKPVNCSYRDGLDLRVGDSDGDTVLDCIARKYDFLEGFNLNDHVLTSDLTAGVIANKCLSFIDSI